MAYTYDDSNIFARILRGEIPNNTVTETEHTLAFRDIRPLAPSHVLDTTGPRPHRGAGPGDVPHVVLRRA